MEISLNELGITDRVKCNSIIGSLLTNPLFKDKCYTHEEILQIIKACVDTGFELSTKIKKRLLNMGVKIVNEKVVGDKITGIPVVGQPTDNFEYQVATYYVYKVESCIRRGIPFELTLNQVKRLLKKKTCFYTGIKLTSVPHTSQSWTLDRKDHKLGYTIENTVVACHLANKLKNALLENDASDFKTDIKTLRRFVSKL